MNIQEPFKTSSVDFNKIVYPKTKNGESKKLVLIKYNEKSKMKNFVFQTPTLLNLFKPELNGNYADIEIRLVGKEQNKVNKFKKFLNDLEDKIKTDAQYYGSSWFNLENDNQTINFQKIVRYSDKHSEGTIKVKIIKNNDFETILQLNNNKRIGVGDVSEDTWCKMILECYGIWINTNNDFGIFFRPILISFTPKEIKVYNYQFHEESDEDNDVDIPDTEVNQNIFMKINSSNEKLKQTNDSTSQLDYNELMKELQSEDNKQTSEVTLSNLYPKEDVSLLDINLKNIYYSESDTKSESNTVLGTESDTESEIEIDLNKTLNGDKKFNSSNIDTETSDN